MYGMSCYNPLGFDSYLYSFHANISKFNSTHYKIDTYNNHENLTVDNPLKKTVFFTVYLTQNTVINTVVVKD